MKFPEKLINYKAIHVSVGLYHGAAILTDLVLEEVD